MGGRIQCSDDVDLALIVEEKAPHSILALGPNTASHFVKYQESHPQTDLTHINDASFLASLGPDFRADFTYVAGVLEQMTKTQASLLLTQLRDLSQLMYAKVPLGKAWLQHASLWEKNDMRSMGFDLISLSAERGKPVGLFCYDSNAYQTQAEWRNSKYWAEPD